VPSWLSGMRVWLGVAAVVAGVGVGFLVKIFASSPSWVVGGALLAGVAGLAAIAVWGYRDHRRRVAEATLAGQLPADSGLWFAVIEVLVGVGVGYLTNVFTSDPSWPVGVAVLAGVAVLVAITVRRFRQTQRSEAAALRGARDGLLSSLTPPPLGPGEHSIATLLSPEHVVAPLEARRSTVKKLTRWCTDEPNSPIQVLEGGSGVGKSRLTVEVARALPDMWAAGRWVTGSAEDLIAAVLACRERTLLVVDDADTEPAAKVASLVQQVAQRDHLGMIKVLLVARDRDSLQRAVHRELPAGQQANWPATTLRPVGGAGDRRRWFVRAARAYARAQGLPPPRVSDTDQHPIGADGEPMVVTQARALLASRATSTVQLSAVRSAGIGAVADQIVDAEQRRWTHMARDTRWGIPTTVTAEAQLQAVSALVLLRPETEKDAAAVLRRLPRLNGLDEPTLRNLVFWAHHLYPRAGPALVEPWSDFLTGAILTRLANIADEELSQALDVAAAAERSTTVLTQLIRVSTLFPGVTPLLVRLLQARPTLVTTVIETLVRLGTGVRPLQAPLLPALAANPDLSSQEIDHLLAIIGNVGWAAVRVKLWTCTVQHARHEAASDGSAANRAALADSLSSLGASLRDLGEHRRALAAIEEAVALYRELAAAEPARYTPDLADSLTNLRASLRDLGEHRRALAAIEEAVALYRELAAAEPARYTPDLADSLSSVGASLSDLGEHRRALAAIEEAVALLREPEPARYTPDLARSLNNLGAILSNLGEHRRALAAKEEAVALYRELAAAEPARYTPDLARSLTNLGASLSDLGEHRRALATIEEAVALRRELAAAEPARYTPDLAESLNNLGAILLRDLGEHGRALATIEEAVALLWELAAAEPARYTPYLAGSLTNLGASLSDLGEHHSALTTKEEAVALYRELAAAEPARYTPDLATSLTNLAITLDNLNEQKEALSCRGEVVARWAHLRSIRAGQFEAEYEGAYEGAGSDLARYCAEHGYGPEVASRAERDALQRWYPQT